MKSEKNILIAFVLNFIFSIIEFIGAALTGSVAILSDAVHDLGDSISIGFAYGLEKVSKKKPNNKYTYGYIRYSVLGSLITTGILLAGSAFVIYNAILRLINPVAIDYNGMIVLGIFGVIINFVASYFTAGGNSLNQKSVNLHMLEDMLGWIVVLIGAVIMKFTDAVYIDVVMSIGVAVFIFINALRNMISILDIFLEKTPEDVDVEQLIHHIMELDGVVDVHHFHLRSIDGYNHIATMHIVADGDYIVIKNAVKEEMREHGIYHTTIEIESVNEPCNEIECRPNIETSHHHHHHHC